MTASTSSASTAFTRSLQQSSLAAKALAVLGGAAFIAAAAQIEVPMYPVPMTMQTFAVLLVGALFGWRLALATLVAYVGAGLAGLPVFAGGGSIVTLLLKPATGGYLIGFVGAATLVGWLAERGAMRTVAGTAGAMLAGSAVVYLAGLPWLAAIIGWDKAIAFGLVPFVLGDLLKAGLAGAVHAVAGRFGFAKG